MCLVYCKCNNAFVMLTLLIVTSGDVCDDLLDPSVVTSVCSSDYKFILVDCSNVS